MSRRYGCAWRVLAARRDLSHREMIIRAGDLGERNATPFTIRLQRVSPEGFDRPLGALLEETVVAVPPLDLLRPDLPRISWVKRSPLADPRGGWRRPAMASCGATSRRHGDPAELAARPQPARGESIRPFVFRVLA